MNVGASIFTLVKFYGFSSQIAKFVTAQAAHETAGFSSAILKSNNNLFGMKYAGQSLSTGEKNGYANYKNTDDSIQDFSKWWIKHRQSAIIATPLLIISLDDYVHFLKLQKYFEAPETEYLKGCQFYYNLLF